MNDDVEILLVEDEPDDVELTMRALRSENVKNPIRVARDGEQALDYVFCRGEFSDRPKDRPPKLILLDLNLTRMGGLDVLQQLKVREQTRPIPVVVFTGSHNEREMLESYRLGANSYVVKPADAKRYAQLVGDIAYYWLMVNRSFH